jgi:hypothetical protein
MKYNIQTIAFILKIKIQRDMSNDMVTNITFRKRGTHTNNTSNE